LGDFVFTARVGESKAGAGYPFLLRKNGSRGGVANTLAFGVHSTTKDLVIRDRFSIPAPLRPEKGLRGASIKQNSQMR